MRKKIGLEIIKKCELFNSCTEEQLKVILEKTSQTSVKGGDPVFVINDTSQFVYIVLRGAIDIVGAANVRNQYHKIKTVGPGEYFGEISVLASDRHHTSAFAKESSDLLCIKSEDYLELIRAFPILNSNQTTTLLGYYLNSLRYQIFLPVVKNANEAHYNRSFFKLPALKLPVTRKVVPLRVESNVITVGFCLPISKDSIDQVYATYPEHMIKFTLIDEDCYDDVRRNYLNFYSGQSKTLLEPMPLKASTPTKKDSDASLEDLKSSTLLLSQLSQDIFDWLTPQFEIKDYAEGDIIFSPDMPSDRIYFVGAGQIELNKEIKTLGVLVAYGKAEQYDVFFDTAPFGESTSHVTAIARSTCRIFSLSKETFFTLLKQTDFAIHFSITLAHLINNLTKNVSPYEFYPEYGPKLNLQSQPILPLSKVKASKILPLDLVEKDLTLGVLVPKKEVLDDAIDAYLRGFSVKIRLITEENFNDWTSQAQTSTLSENTVTVFRNSANDNRTLKTVPHDSTAALDSIIEEAITTRASDIHFEPSEKSMVIRYRIDGVITQLWDNIPVHLGLDVVRRVKVLSKMDTTETRLPQDGQFKFQKNQSESSFRVSSVPTRFGEKLVLRATGKKNAVIPLQLLAPNAQITKFFNRLVKYQQGIFFITGPTGSGKSTTMYSILNELNTRDKNIITIEDPVEANISGINQIEINPSIGLTHESILRSVLRQDPDVVMIGEIRDSVSMQLALNAALAGQLVLTTIHASNTFEVIPRIKELGGTTSHIASGLIGVMAQRLVRKLCDCKKPRAVTSNEMALFQGLNFKEPVTHIMDAVGCSECNFTGFQGQIPIFEFWEKTMRVHNALIDERPADEIIGAIRESDVESLTAYSLKMVAQGLTTINEVNDVLFGITDLMAS